MVGSETRVLCSSKGWTWQCFLKNCLVSTVMGFEDLVKQSMLTWNIACRYSFKTIFQIFFLKKVLGHRKNFHMLVNIWELMQKGRYKTKLSGEVKHGFDIYPYFIKKFGLLEQLKKKRKKRQNRFKRRKFYETMCASKMNTCSVVVLFVSLKYHQGLYFSGTL